MMREMLLALGVLLPLESQLRLGSLPVGPGEICLVAWLFLIPRREAVRLVGRPLLTTAFSKTAFSKLLVFWLLFAFAQSVGTVTGFVIGDKHDSDLFLHDALAYPLLAAVSCLSVVEPEAGPRLRRVAWMLVALGSATLAPQLASAWGLFQIPDLEPWYWDRFRGWSENPNQLAFLCAVLGLLSLYLAETAAGLGEGIAAVSCIILPAYVGLLTKSNTFTLVLAAAGPIFVTFKLWTWMLSAQGGMTLRLAFVWDDPESARHPKATAAPNCEAHNTLLDLFTQGALIAVLSFVWLEAKTFFFAYKARLAALMTTVCCLVIFTTFHLLTRHPIFWFVIALYLVAGDGADRAIAVRDRS